MSHERCCHGNSNRRDYYTVMTISKVGATIMVSVIMPFEWNIMMIVRINPSVTSPG